MGGADYAGTFGSTSAVGTGGELNPSLDGSALACHVVLDSLGQCVECEVVGTAGDGEACFGRQDCAAGFACADDGNGVGVVATTAAAGIPNAFRQTIALSAKLFSRVTGQLGLRQCLPALGGLPV